MPNVNIFVPVGAIAQTAAGQSIGTDGCSMCVGLVALMPDNTRRCAHFASNLLGNPAQIANIQASARWILDNFIAHPAQGALPLEIQACTTSSRVKQSTGAICAAIEAYFPGTVFHDAKGIYITEAGVFGIANGNTDVIGPAAPANDHAVIG